MVLIWLYKPHEVEEPIAIDLSGCARCADICHRGEFEGRGFRHVQRRVIRRARNMKIDSDISETPYWIPSLVLVILISIYGAVHAGAWNAHFPTPAEQTLWRVAACSVASGGLILMLCTVVYEDIPDFLVPPRLPPLLLGGCVFVMLSLSRVFLVVEAFVSLRSVPVEAYDSISWVNALPHIG